jgi:hypothetical protein
MKTPTLQEFKRWSKAHGGLAEAVCMAQAFAQCERERVDAYIKPLFELFDFYVAERFVERGRPQERITDVNRLYLTDLEGAEYKRFVEECDKEHRAHGFKGKAGHCPALVAESLQIIAENALLKAGGELLGVDFTSTSMELRAKALDLLLGACLKKEAA